MGSARGQGPSAEDAVAKELVKALYSVPRWSWPGRVKAGPAEDQSSAPQPPRPRDIQAGLVGTRYQDLQGELGDDGREPPDTVWPVKEDRHCVAEVATLAEVGIALVLHLQQVGQGQCKHFLHLRTGGSETVDRGLTMQLPHWDGPVPRHPCPYSPPRGWAGGSGDPVGPHQQAPAPRCSLPGPGRQAVKGGMALAGLWGWRREAERKTPPLPSRGL